MALHRSLLSFSKAKALHLTKALQQISGVAVKFSNNGWMNDMLTIDYLHSIVGTFLFTKHLLVWDAYVCHTSVVIRGETAKLRLHTAIVPGGCTKFIQDADVVWNSCFKCTCEPFMTPGSPIQPTMSFRAPLCSLLCQWVKTSWNAIPVDMAKNLFTSCAISTSPDDSEHDKIHCFKPGQPCEEGRGVLADKMKHFWTEPDETDDPFSSDEDPEEAENNQVCIDDDNDHDEDSDGGSSCDDNI